MDERMMILNMLQEGKITSEEAYKLISALDSNAANEKSNYTSGQSRESIRMEEKLNRISEKANKFSEKFNEKANKFAEKLDESFDMKSERYSDDFSKRMESVGNDIAESAVKFADKLVNFLGGMIDVNGDKYKYFKSYSFPIVPDAQLNLKSDNFSIKVAPSDSDNIIINLYANGLASLIPENDYLISNINGSKYSFSTDFPSMTWGRVELLVPEGMQSLDLYTSNGKCDINDISCDISKFRTSNSKISLFNCSFNQLDTISSNGKIMLEKTKSGSTSLKTSNGKVEIQDCQFDSVNAYTSNGSIQIAGIGRSDIGEAKYNLFTSNGKIYITLSDYIDCGYQVDANTSLGSISITLPELNYFVDRKSTSMHSNATIKSASFDSKPNKVFIKATTSNASITIEGN